MTKEEAEKYAENLTYREAIQNLKQARSVPYRKATFIKINELLDKLEQEPATKNDVVDAISREQALKELKESAEHHANNSREEVLLRRDRDIIRALPPVTPREPRKGHWIWEIDETPSTSIAPYELNYAGWVCSCCHEFPDDKCEWDDPDEPPTYKFCPNCGADMREVDE